MKKLIFSAILILIFNTNISIADEHDQSSSKSYQMTDTPLQIKQPMVHIKKDKNRIGIAIYSSPDKKSELIKSECYDAHPNWSHDYQKIVLTSDCISGGKNFMKMADIYSINKDGSGRTRLTHSGRNFAPRWSHNNKKIVFQSNRKRKEQIYIMDHDGSNQINISNNEYHEAQPDWSPIDDRIVFTSGESFDSRNIHVMDSNGKNIKKLTNFESSTNNPRWSPDAQHILFTSTKNGRSHLYLMDSDGAKLKDITPEGYSILMATWSQKGDKIAITKTSKEYGMNIAVIDIKKHMIYQAINAFSSAPDW